MSAVRALCLRVPSWREGRGALSRLQLRRHYTDAARLSSGEAFAGLTRLITTKIPMPDLWKTALQLLALAALILYLLTRFGPALPNVLP